MPILIIIFMPGLRLQTDRCRQPAALGGLGQRRRTATLEIILGHFSRDFNYHPTRGVRPK